MDQLKLPPENGPKRDRSKWPITLILGGIIACVVLPVLAAVGPSTLSRERARWLMAAAENSLEESEDGDDEYAKKTRELLEKAVELDPSIRFSPEFFDVNLRSGKLEASEAYNIYLEAPESMKPRVAIGFSRIFAKNKNFKVAFDFMKIGMPRLQDRSPIANNEFAYSAALSGEELDEALTAIDKAIESESNSAFLDTKAWVLFNRDENAKALEVMDEAISVFNSEVENAVLSPGQRKAWLAFRAETDGKSVDSSSPVPPIQSLSNPTLRELFRTFAVYQFHRAEILKKLGRGGEAQKIVDWLGKRGFPDLEKLH
jgi:tetratricopeptide (TPR) repeat protein